VKRKEKTNDEKDTKNRRIKKGEEGRGKGGGSSGDGIGREV
jgi:hypothetical protein